MVGAASPATAIDEGIKHQVEELIGKLEGRLLCAGRGHAGSWLRALVSGSKAGDSAPPELNTVLSALATF
jgi:uncharacterized protein YgfB (UPF0149 family)